MSHFSTNYWILALLHTVILGDVATPASSIVPEREWIDDFQASKSYAKALEEDPQTLPQAIEIYKSLHDKHPEDVFLSLELERAQWDLDHPEEKETSTSLVPKGEWIKDSEVILTLAQIFSGHKGNYLEAIEDYQLLLAEDPDNLTLLLEVGNLYLTMKRYPDALTILDRVRVLATEPAIKMAQFEASLGYVYDSQQIFNRLPVYDSVESALQYADAMISWGDFYRAESLYSEAWEEHPGSLEMIKRMIDVKAAIQNFEDAEKMALEQLELYPQYQEALLTKLIEIELLRKKYCEAVANAERLIELDPTKSALHMVLANTLYAAEKYEEALEIYLALKDDPDFYSDACLGAGSCYLQLGGVEQAESELLEALKDTTTEISASYLLAGDAVLEDSFICEIIENGTTAQELQLCADSYSRDGYSEPMRRIYIAAVFLDPDYFPSQVSLAETLTAELDFETSIEIYTDLLDEFPDNTKLLLGQARETSWNKEFDEAICLYQHLIDLNPEDPLPLLEQARVAYWGNEYTLSMNLYDQLLELPNLNEEIFYKTVLEKQIVQLLWNYRPWHTLCFYEELLALEPLNDTWKFGYAQALCSLGLCETTIDLYREISHENPSGALSNMALERTENHEHLSVTLNYTYWRDKGYGQLDQIGRYEGNLIITFPLSCQQHIRLIPRSWVEHTFFDSRYHPAEGISVEWDNRFNAFLTAAADFTYKNYLQEYGPTFTGFGRIGCNLYDFAELNLIVTRADVVCNTFNLQQRTQKTVWGAELNSNITHALELKSLFEYIDYNDHNSCPHYAVNVNYALTNHPKIFRVGLAGEYRNTAYTNIYMNGPQGQLLNIIHPYWAPQDYYLGEVHLDWRHDYGFLDFCGAPSQFYNFRLAFGDDTQHNHYWEIKGEWVHEFYSHWKLSATGYIHRSPMWDGTGLWCTIGYEF